MQSFAPLILSKFTNCLKAYFIESLPDVPFDLGEMYSGNIPIDMNDTSRQLFFVFQPTIGNPVDEITIWLNGGPGCSSLEGFFQENGRFLWQSGTYAPVENPYSWVNLTNMLWYRNYLMMSLISCADLCISVGWNNLLEPVLPLGRQQQTVKKKLPRTLSNSSKIFSKSLASRTLRSMSLAKAST